MTRPVPLWGKTTEVEIYGERLRDARVIQRLKAAAIAEAAGLTSASYSRLENSVSSNVAVDRAHRLANAVDFPLGFLSAPPLTQVQRGSLLFRAKKAMTRAEEDQLVAWSRLIGDLLQRVEPEVRLPYVRIPRIPSGTTPKDAARQTREAMGLEPETPIPHLTRALERSGVYVSVLNFDAELHAKHHDAFSTWVGHSLDRPVIVVRSIASWERTRLSIAHELGHLAMHYIRRDGDLEAEAYAFAAEFLLPSSQLAEHWPRQATLLSLMPLKRTWGMSLSSLIEHGYRNNLLGSDQRTNFYKQMSNRKDRITGERWRIQEPGWNEREAERPKLVAKVAETAFGPVTTVDDIASQVCNWRVDYVNQLIAGQVTPWARRVVVGDEAGGHNRPELIPDLAPVLQIRS